MELGTRSKAPCSREQPRSRLSLGGVSKRMGPRFWAMVSLLQTELVARSPARILGGETGELLRPAALTGTEVRWRSRTVAAMAVASRMEARENSVLTSKT